MLLSENKEVISSQMNILFKKHAILSKSVFQLRICQEAGRGGDLQNALRISIQLSSLVNKESRSSEAAALPSPLLAS